MWKSAKRIHSGWFDFRDHRNGDLSAFLSFTGILMAILAGSTVLQLQTCSRTCHRRLASSCHTIAPPNATKLGKFMDDLAFKLRPPMARSLPLPRDISLLRLWRALLVCMWQRQSCRRMGRRRRIHDCSTTPKSDVVLRPLLRFLTAHRLLLSDGDPSTTRFGLTAATRLLLEEAPGSAWGMVIVRPATIRTDGRI